jgi:hypothetical protein
MMPAAEKNGLFATSDEDFFDVACGRMGSKRLDQ